MYFFLKIGTQNEYLLLVLMFFPFSFASYYWKDYRCCAP